MRYVQPHKTLMAAHPAISAWLARCHDRSGFQAMVSGRNAEPA
jgi:glutathione S-transferase